MRVAFVAMETTHYRDTEGARRLERVARSLADAGHEVTIFCSQWWDGDHETFAVEDVTYRAVTPEPAATSFAVRLPYLLARFGPDVIHATPRPPAAAVAARLGGTFARAPTALEWYGDEGVAESRTASWAIRGPDRIVTPSEMVRTRVRERGADGDQTVIVPESIDMDLVRETDPGEEIDVAYAHPLDESANVQSLFLGLAELREKDWSATIIGDGPHREDYERQARDLRIDDRVEFAGACDRERRVEIYKGAHVFVQTAYRESFASELLWALACGCVGIVEYQAESSAHELIEQRERSFRVTNTQQMADAIVDSAQFDRETVDESLAEFDHDTVTRRYEDCYEAISEEYGLF